MLHRLTDFVVGRTDQILVLAGPHLLLILVSLAISTPLGLSLGITAAYSRGFRAVVLYILDFVTTASVGMPTVLVP